MTRPPRLGPLRERLELGLLAFTPAMALLAIRTGGDGWWWLLFAVPALLGGAVAVGAAVVVGRAAAEPFGFAEIDDVGDEVIGHVGAYLLPVLVGADQSAADVLIVAASLALIVLIHVATGRVHVNPLLYVFGYRVYRACTDTGVAYYLLAHTDPAGWATTRRCAPLASSILVERRRDAAAVRAGTGAEA